MHLLKDKIKEQLCLAEDAAAWRIFSKIFDYAALEEIEEIIIEPEGEKAVVKFFDAGENKGCLAIKLDSCALVRRLIRELAGIKDGIAGCPAQGKFKREILGRKTVFSASFYPQKEGEKIIITVQKESFSPLAIGQLGMEKNVLRKVKESLNKKRGIIFVLGVFDSGKTGTLYSLLNFLNGAELNIATIEKEIIFDLPHANQSRLHPAAGFDQNSALNSLLRQDPDVIMADELSEREPLEAVLRLAERGHLVLGAVYSRDVSVFLDFLLGLGIDLKQFCRQARLVINQRLAKRNCPHCLKKEKLTVAALQKIKIKLGADFFAVLKNEKIISAPAKKWEDLNFFQSGGCDACQRQGGAGKIGLFEILEINEPVKKKISEGHLSKVKDEIRAQGNYTLAEEAMIKAVRGTISLSGLKFLE